MGLKPFKDCPHKYEIRNVSVNCNICEANKTKVVVTVTKEEISNEIGRDIEYTLYTGRHLKSHYSISICHDCYDELSRFAVINYICNHNGIYDNIGEQLFFKGLEKMKIYKRK